MPTRAYTHTYRFLLPSLAVAELEEVLPPPATGKAQVEQASSVAPRGAMSKLDWGGPGETKLSLSSTVKSPAAVALFTLTLLVAHGLFAVGQFLGIETDCPKDLTDIQLNCQLHCQVELPVILF